jgi:hypothetical protein
MDRIPKIVLAAAVGIGCLVASGSAGADWHGHVGVWIGPGPYGWGPAYYYPPYYYSPPVVVTEPAPVYVPPPNPVVQVPAPQTYWYYCRRSNAYYPYVSECPGGWQPVTPQPPAPAPAPAPR